MLDGRSAATLAHQSPFEKRPHSFSNAASSAVVGLWERPKGGILAPPHTTCVPQFNGETIDFAPTLVVIVTFQLHYSFRGPLLSSIHWSAFGFVPALGRGAFFFSFGLPGNDCMRYGEVPCFSLSV